ncbi:LysR family transcriptional regulator [Devosia soli]|nr:LysR family transcriptional regulator [Devosia soli]
MGEQQVRYRLQVVHGCRSNGHCHAVASCFGLSLLSVNGKGLIAEREAIDKAAKLYEPIENLTARAHMSRNINLNAVRIFAVVARHSSFQRAAEALSISHGAVSQRIKQLEGELGVALFERQARGVRLTENGERYQDAVDAALSILTTANANLERGQSQVVLHLGPSFASRWLMPRLKRFTRQVPHVAITTEVHEGFLQRALGRNEIAIWPDRTPQHAPGQHVERLTALQLVAVCSPQLRRPDSPMDFEAMLSLPLLQDAHRRWERLIGPGAHQAKGGLLNFDRSALALDAAINGHGVAIAPVHMMADDLESGRLLEIWREPESSGQHLFMSWAEQHRADGPVNKTVNWILAEFGLQEAGQLLGSRRGRWND